jgi:ABC-type dipeptide/oligopeptide/nickel transport system ATPase component
VLDRGEVCEEGSVVEILERPKQPYTRALLDAAPRLASV